LRRRRRRDSRPQFFEARGDASTGIEALAVIGKAMKQKKMVALDFANSNPTSLETARSALDLL
jgi:hypothetical protein